MFCDARSLASTGLRERRVSPRVSPRYHPVPIIHRISRPFALIAMGDSNLAHTRTLVAATAAIAAAVTAGSILGGQAIRRRLRTAELKRQVEADLAGQPWNDTSATVRDEADEADALRIEPAEKVWARGEYDEELIREQVRSASHVGCILCS